MLFKARLPLLALRGAAFASTCQAATSAMASDLSELKPGYACATPLRCSSLRIKALAYDPDPVRRVRVAMEERKAKFGIGQVVRHRRYPFRGVVYDVDPVFANTEEWWLAIPEEMRPAKEQPFYHLFAENSETEYVAYVSEQNLLPDASPEPLRHPQIDAMFERRDDGSYHVKSSAGH